MGGPVITYAPVPAVPYTLAMPINSTNPTVVFLGGDFGSQAAAIQLTQAATTSTPATSGVERAAWVNDLQRWGTRRIFVTVDGLGAAASGTVSLEIQGNTYTPATDSYQTGQTETLIADITSPAADATFVSSETVLWIGQVTFALVITSGSPATYNLNFNIGAFRSIDFGGFDVEVVSAMAALGHDGADDTDVRCRFFTLPTAPAFTYSLAAYAPGLDVAFDIAGMTDDSIGNDDGTYGVPIQGLSLKTTELSFMCWDLEGSSSGVSHWNTTLWIRVIA